VVLLVVDNRVTIPNRIPVISNYIRTNFNNKQTEEVKGSYGSQIACIRLVVALVFDLFCFFNNSCEFRAFISNTNIVLL
jgi:hypothetical protein